jgi:hypothetical protein
MTGYTPYFLLYGRHPILAFDIADHTWEALDWHTVHSTEDLIAIRTQQILRRDKRLVQAHENQRKNRQRAIDDFNKRYEKILVTNDFEVGTWVWVHETWLDTQKGNKGALRWSGPFIIHEKVVHDGKLRGYKLRELDGNVRRSTVALDRVKIFYYRSEHQTIKTYTTERYLCAIQNWPDPEPLLHSEVYQRGVSFALSLPVTAALSVRRKFDSVVPILDIGHAVCCLSIAEQRRMDDWELCDLSWEDPVNFGLIYEPFLVTNKTKQQGSQYCHPMIGDLEDEFRNGTTEVYIEHRPQWGPIWVRIQE